MGTSQHFEQTQCLQNSVSQCLSHFVQFIPFISTDKWELGAFEVKVSVVTHLYYLTMQLQSHQARIHVSKQYITADQMQ
jgi:hypothetical protein